MTVTESAPAVPEATDASEVTDVEILWERLARVEERVRHAVAARRATDPEPDDPYRGQYLTPEAVERILESRDAFAPVPAYRVDQLPYVTEQSADPSAPAPHPGSRLDRLARSFGLVPLDVELLLVGHAACLHRRLRADYGSVT